VNKEYPYKFVKSLQQFTESLERNFGPYTNGEIQLNLPRRLYNIAWREVVDSYAYLRHQNHDYPNQLTMHRSTGTIVLKPIEDKETE